MVFRKFVISLLLSMMVTATVSSQEETDFNRLYRYPFSVGFEYQFLSPLPDYAAQFRVYDLAVNFRMPIGKAPVVQPLMRLGMMVLDSQDPLDPDKWDANHFYGELGLGYSHRFDKKFEMGVEGAAGMSYAVYPDLVPSGPVGEWNFLADIGGRIIFSPSYNLALDLHPGVRYLRSIGNMHDHDGFIINVGLSLSYRFGNDPDSTSSVIRSLKVEELEVPDVFAAMQSYYADHPMGNLTLLNTENNSVRDLSVSFYQAGYMDAPTPVATVEELKSGESAEIELTAAFNQNVFSLEGITPLTGEVIAAYTYRSRPVEQRFPVTYDLYDKTSMVWDDDRKVAAFITPADSALGNYASFIRQSCKDEVLPFYSSEIQFGIQVFHALKELGVLYQVDPLLPFTEAREGSLVVDSVNLPRTTLGNITGDCDDLTVLYASLLETTGVESGFVTVPGHIYAVLNTGVDARNYRKIHPDRDMTIVLDGELWIPVEITMIGKSDFVSAWRKGMEQWKRYDVDPGNRNLYRTRDSQLLYRPIWLSEKDLGLQYGRGEDLAERFSGEMASISDAVASEYAAAAQDSGRPADYNRLGIVRAQFGRNDKALAAFRTALRLDPEYLPARANLANISFLEEDYAEAYEMYLGVYERLQKDGQGDGQSALKVLINLSRSAYSRNMFGEAAEFYRKAEALDPEQAARFSYILDSTDDSGSRAAAQPYGEESILFLE